jgi:hypothetical protein
MIKFISGGPVVIKRSGSFFFGGDESIENRAYPIVDLTASILFVISL